MARCEVCDKTLSFGNKISITRSHTSRRTTRTFRPNLRTVKVATENGQNKKIYVCAKCLRAGKVKRA